MDSLSLSVCLSVCLSRVQGNATGKHCGTGGIRYNCEEARRLRRLASMVSWSVVLLEYQWYVLVPLFR
jgi:hypothetical protein